MARFVSKNSGLKEKYIETLKDIASNHKDSPTTIDRVNSLVKYNFDEETARSFNQFLNDLHK